MLNSRQLSELDEKQVQALLERPDPVKLPVWESGRLVDDTVVWRHPEGKVTPVDGVPNAVWYERGQSFGGMMDGGKACIHHVYIPGPDHRISSEDGSYAPYCEGCRAILLRRKALAC